LVIRPNVVFTGGVLVVLVPSVGEVTAFEVDPLSEILFCSGERQEVRNKSTAGQSEKNRHCVIKFFLLPSICMYICPSQYLSGL